MTRRDPSDDVALTDSPVGSLSTEATTNTGSRT